MKTMNPTEFRKNLFKELDQVLETGEPLIIIKAGRRLQISVLENPDEMAADEEFIIRDPMPA